MGRRRSAEIVAEATEALTLVLEDLLGPSGAVSTGSRGGPDIVVSLPDGSTLALEVRATAQRAEPGPISNALPTWDASIAQLRERLGTEVVGMVVAEAIPESTKSILREHGWGWLDRRGELDLRASSLIVHTTDLALPSSPTGLRHRAPIRGRAGITTAACLLMAPGAVPGVREIARRGNLAPSSVSGVFAELRNASLVEDDGRPLVPELFWALSDAWQPKRHAFAELPAPGSRLQLGLEELDQPGWAVGDTVAAVAWAAPVVVVAGAAPDFYVPSDAHLRGALRELRPAHSLRELRCTVAVAPTELVVQPRYDGGALAAPWLHWPIVHPLFVALDLARDRARGVEILHDWQPPEPFAKVW